MHERKKKMIDLGDLYVALPGGTGTLEEITEAISWANLGLIRGACFFVNTNGFYDYLKIFFETMQVEGYLHADKTAEVAFVDSIGELFIKIG